MSGAAVPSPQPDDADEGHACATCGHGRRAHEHYRSGSDCALCDCRRFRRPLLRRLLGR